jgi:hypothetical protein
MAMASISFDGSSAKAGLGARIAAHGDHGSTVCLVELQAVLATRTEVEISPKIPNGQKGCEGAGGVLPLAPSLSAPFNRSLIGAGSACVRDAAVSGRRSQTIFGQPRFS